MLVKVLEWCTSYLGFETRYVEKIKDDAQRKWLFVCNSMVFGALLLLSFSCALLVLLSVDRGGLGLLLSIATFFIAFSVLVAAHRLLIQIDGSPLHKKSHSISQWYPSPLRLILFFALGLVLAQPLLVFFHGEALTEQAEKNVSENAIAKFQGADSNRLTSKINELLTSASVLEEEIQRVSPVLLTSNEMASRMKPRKAFLVGASKYHAPVNPLPNTFNDVAGLEKKLQSMGYMVTVSMDDSLLDIKKKLHSYIGSLQPNDISFIYFSGHGIQQNGYNYFIPIDYASKANTEVGVKQLREHGFMLNQLMDSLTRVPIRLNLIILDACRNSFDNNENGLATMQNTTSKNTMVVMSASPGQKALDSLSGQQGGNSPFTGSLLKNLARDEDVGKIMRRVRSDTLALTEDTKRQQGEPPQSPWVSESFSDLEIKLVMPTLQTSESEKSLQQLKNIAPKCINSDKKVKDSDSYSYCLYSELQNTRRKIDYLQIRGASTAANNGEWIREYSSGINFLGERLRFMWQSPISSSLLTLIFGITVIIGVVLRDFIRPNALRSYELVRTQMMRIFLKHQHFSYQATIDAILSKDRDSSAIPYHSHWSDDEDFYSKEYNPPALKNVPDTRLNAREMQKMWSWLSAIPTTGSEK
jgi:hypothetical protein